MKFGIHNPSWVFGPDPAEAFEAIKAKAQWAEDHGFVWFSVMDHMIQIPGVGAPDEPLLEGWTVLAGLAAVGPHPSRHPVHGGQLSQSRASRQDRGERRSDQPRSTDARHRRRLFRGGIQAIRLGGPAATCDSHPADGGGGRADPEDVARAAGDLPRPVFPRRGRDPRAEAGAKAASA